MSYNYIYDDSPEESYADPKLFKDEISEADKDSVFEVLNRLKPLSSTYKNATFNEVQTYLEFIEWSKYLFWCPDGKFSIDRCNQDMYKERNGDDYIHDRLFTFNQCRRLWINEILNRELDSDSRKVAKEYEKYVTSANTTQKRNATVSLFCKKRLISADVLNQESELIGTPRGVYDLGRRRYWREANANYYMAEGSGFYGCVADKALEYHITKSTKGYMYSGVDESDGDEDCFQKLPKWEEFILEIMSNDEEKADYLQRALGYSIYGGNPEEVMFVAFGATTRNGKGTLLNTVAYALGEYAASVPGDFLTRRRGGSQSNFEDALGSLEGKRFVIMSEPTAGHLLDESRIKAYTGCDEISAARKYCQTRRFEPQFTMWLACNQLPNVEDTTVFTSGRMKVIPFERHFSAEEQDHKLKRLFTSERALYTVMEWLTDGYQKYKKYGLVEPECIKEAIRQWTETGGSELTKFIDNCCYRETSARVKSSVFNEEFKKYCEESGFEPWTSKATNEGMEKLSIPRVKNGGVFIFKGIGLKKEIGL